MRQKVEIKNRKLENIGKDLVTDLGIEQCLDIIKICRIDNVRYSNWSV